MVKRDEAGLIAVHIACGSLAPECIAEGAAQIRASGAAIANARLEQAAGTTTNFRVQAAIRALKMGAGDDA
jgi:leucyl aminopeptidase (aminopeptidase T)